MNMYNYEIMIEKVRKNENDIITDVYTHIGQLTKEQIISEIKKGIHVYTRTGQGIGSKVNMCSYNGVEDIRSVKNAITHINLDNLPSF